VYKSNCNGITQLFNERECEVRSVAGHNIHEKEGGRTQEGGTSMLRFGPLNQTYDFKASGKDKTGLVRWVSMVLRGSDGIITRFV
jgi:hypothetical protein